MKRSIFLAIILGVALLGVTAIALAQAPSVPNLINFQGRLTDLAGNPVANGAHTVDFYIFPVRAGGGSVWSETQTPTTTGGLFTTQLGLVNPLPATLFEDYDSLFLEIVADAQLISPRTLLTSTPSTRVANALEVQSLFDPTRAGIKTDPFGHILSIHSGTDGGPDQLMGGNGFGETWWLNGAPSHLVTASIGAYPGSGGRMALYDDLGGFKIALDGGALGDASAILPTDAVNSGEILDEPGIAHSFHYDQFFLGVVTATDTVTITAPAAGFVVVTAQANFQYVHTNGTEDVGRACLSSTPNFIDFNNFAYESYPAAAASGTAGCSFSLMQVLSVSAGSHTYYLNADRLSGSPRIYRRHLMAQYFPTNYGTVVSTKPVQSRVGGNVAASVDAAGTDQPSEVQTTTVADHQAQLEAERAKQMADLEARIKRLEGQAAGQLPGQGTGTPRKER